MRLGSERSKANGRSKTIGRSKTAGRARPNERWQVERPATSGLSNVAFTIGLAAAVPAFAATFRGPRDRFWSRMTATGLLLGGLALFSMPWLRRTRIGRTEAALGLASAAALYVTFELGDRFARSYVPGGDRQIREIYSLRELRPRGETALRLVTIIGPAEELFWRGLVQEVLMRRHGRWRGAAMAAVAYSAVHVTTGNFTLMGAAGVAGAHWCALYAAGVPIGTLIVSHCAWDVWIFLVQPTGEVTAIASAGEPLVDRGVGPAVGPLVAGSVRG